MERIVITSYNLDEQGTLRLYNGPRLLCFLIAVDEASVEMLVDEMEAEYQKEWRTSNS